MEPIRVVLLPGSVLPAEPAYGALIEALGPDVDAVAKDLELYDGDEPPPGWSLDTEIDGVLREAEARGWETFHLLGYSGGGAASLAFAAKHPQRLLSLTLLEPAWAGSWDWSPAHTRLWKDYEALESLPPDQFMAAFMRLGVKPDVVLPPPPEGGPPPWMAKRPAGIRAFLRDFKIYDLDRARLAAFNRPVFFVLGGLSNPDDYGEVAERLSTVFPDFRLEVFPDRHHFDPPHRIEPDRLGALLRDHWERANRVV
ncbi:alpha/beta fold hydrolase [Arthrobacter bambusae]|uniref:Pimeloyl-ACP methyl ester carboxylesterase n=1 Tax=Arthrobacter bambusae TaxID=1338426 RepID=A0AAW8DLU1_9MICC|nr:alpha/beta hydrolase [Arthrobacter bambusae]MDP9907330.1 pimeloyl-ACP methyl ester carboxylesterase [Arthrobacter bambusae]MDQ0131198.1 pimeloyl-ACP methyl ester carboxylesterase [Arthrobacter bambusae]MDQ0182801.1 pimeloyl-ACP methyl ester carboxylesterase [Arthrobacter bambusae]